MEEIKKRYEQEHPERIGETEKAFADMNYIEWLESKFISPNTEVSDEEIRKAVSYALWIKQTTIDFPKLHPPRTNDEIINEVVKTHSEQSCLTSKELDCMYLSEKSLSKDWNNKADEHWNSIKEAEQDANFLKEWHKFLKDNKIAITVDNLDTSEIVGMYKGDFITMQQAYSIFKQQSKTK